MDRCKANEPNCGLRSVEGSRPTTEEAIIAKNYLDPIELRRLENVAEMWMGYVESRALLQEKLTMAQMLFQVQTLIKFLDLPVLFEYPRGYSRPAADAYVKAQLGAYKAKNVLSGVRRALGGKTKEIEPQ